jgi:hypothetical protein
MINIKIKNGDPCNTVITDEDGKEITGIESLVIDPIVAKKPITATLKMLVNELDVDADLSRENMLEAKGFERVGMALTNNNLTKGQQEFIQVHNQQPLIALGDCLLFAGSPISYIITGIIRERGGLDGSGKTMIEIHEPLDSKIADNAVILIYRKGEQ